MSDRLRLVLADDHPLFRKGLRALLSTLPEVIVVGEAASGAEAVHKAQELRPDLLLVDLQMPEGGGLRAIREVAASNPEIHILVVTMFEDDDSVFAAMRAGARGYVLKDMEEEMITRAILAVGNGEAIFSPTIAARMMNYFANKPDSAADVFPDLTESEGNVLRLMAQGYKNPEIAQRLSLSPKTVRNYISSIFSKLQVADRTQAVLRARKAGFE